MKLENKKLVFGVFIGIAISIFLYFSFEYLTKHYVYAIITLVIIFIIVSIVYFLITYNFSSIVSSLTGFNSDNDEDIKETTKTLIKALIKRDIEKIEQTQDKVINHFGFLISQGIGLNWIIRTFLSFTLAIAGILGTILLIQQNRLMENQDTLIQNQNKLIEKDIRPFVWSGSALITVDNKSIQLLSQVNNKVINSPAKIEKATYLYYLKDETGNLDTIDFKTLNVNEIWYPIQETRIMNVNTRVSKDFIKEIPKKKELYRVVEILYDWIGSNKNQSSYYFKGTWKLNKYNSKWYPEKMDGN